MKALNRIGLNHIISLFLFLLFFLPKVNSQDKSFPEIDKYAMAAPASISNIDSMCAFLIKSAKNDKEKIRSIYVWIANNIKYDMKGYLAEKYPPYDPETVFKNRYGVCQGMANLFKYMCDKANVKAEVVDGYSKGFGYTDGIKFILPDHAWNVVFIDGKWQHLDVTWDVTTTNMPDQFPYRAFEGNFFLVPSEEFLVNHLSTDPIWQLSEYILPLKEYEKANAGMQKITPPKITFCSFNDSVNAFCKMDTIDAMISYGRRSMEFNPANSEAKVIYALNYFHKGQAIFKNISDEDYEKNYQQYEDLVNSYFDKSYDVLKSVKPGMKFYKEAQEAAEYIDNHKIKTSVEHSTTLDENYKVNNYLKIHVLSKNVKLEIKELRLLNSEYVENNLNVSPDGKFLYFRSDRGGMPWSQKNHTDYKGRLCYDGDIYYSQKTNGEWQKPVCLDRTVNTFTGEDEPNISPDGNKLVFQSWKRNWKSTGGPYYIADLKNNKVKDLKGLGDGISRFFVRLSSERYSYGTDGASMSPDGKRFIVAAGDYWGNLDFYMSEKDVSGKWGTMEPLRLNTPADDRSIFIASDGVTIFFASDGYGGFGGLDIFKTTIDEQGYFGEIINLGSVINTPADDFGFILSGDGQEGFFIRDGDIYQVTFKEKVDEIAPGKTLVVKGTISHAENNNTKCVIQLKDNEKQNVVSATEDKDGTYYFFLKNVSHSYTISVLDEDMKLAERTIKVDLQKNYNEVIEDFTISGKKPEAVKDSVVNRIRLREEIYEHGLFSNVNFGYNQHQIEEQYVDQLAKIAAYLKEHPNTKLTIGGYSDIRGDKDFNYELSRKRGQSVYDFMIKQGVNKKQLIMIAYGSENPLTLDETIQGGWVNRRVEFKIINGFPVRIK